MSAAAIPSGAASGKRTHEPSSQIFPIEPESLILRLSQHDSAGSQRSFSNRVTDLSAHEELPEEFDRDEIERAKKQRLTLDSDPQRHPRIFLDAINEQRVDIVKEMLRNATLPAETIENAYLQAAGRGLWTIMSLLLDPVLMEKHLPIQSNTLREAIFRALREGRIEMTEHLCDTYLADNALILMKPKQPFTEEQRKKKLIQILTVALREANHAYFITRNPDCAAIFGNLIRRLVIMRDSIDEYTAEPILMETVESVSPYGRVNPAGQEAAASVLRHFSFTPQAIQTFSRSAASRLRLAPLFQTPVAGHFDVHGMLVQILRSPPHDKECAKESIEILLTQMPPTPISDITLPHQTMVDWIDDPKMLDLLLSRFPQREFIDSVVTRALSENQLASARTLMRSQSFQTKSIYQWIAMAELKVEEAVRAQIISEIQDRFQIDAALVKWLRTHAHEYYFGNKPLPK